MSAGQGLGSATATGWGSPKAMARGWEMETRSASETGLDPATRSGSETDWGSPKASDSG